MHKTRADIPTQNGTADSYLVMPDGGGPGVLLFPDAFGLRPRIEEMADPGQHRKRRKQLEQYDDTDQDRDIADDAVQQPL